MTPRQSAAVAIFCALIPLRVYNSQQPAEAYRAQLAAEAVSLADAIIAATAPAKE